MIVFVGGPFSAAMAVTPNGVCFNQELGASFRRVHAAVAEVGATLWSSHVSDRFGAEFNADELVPRDNAWVWNCDLYLCLLPLDPTGRPYRTDGTFVEIGLAVAHGKPVLIAMEDPNNPGHSYYVRNLDAQPNVRFIDWDKFMAEPVRELGRVLGDIEHRIVSADPVRTEREQFSDPELALARLERRSVPEEVVVRGVKIVALPGVFSPSVSHAPDFLASHWTIPSGARVLDLGCGCGVLGILAVLESGGTLVAVDSNPRAVVNTQINVDLHGLTHRARVFESDSYSSLSQDEVFDTILLSPPFWNRRALTPLARACYDFNHSFLSDSLRGAGRHIHSDGSVFVVFSDQGDTDFLVQEARAAGFLIRRLQVQRPTQPMGHIRIMLELCPAPTGTIR